MTTLQTETDIAVLINQHSPARIFETLNRYQHTAALKGAIELDLFSYIDAGATTAESLAARLQASERGVRILCDFLTIIGFLTKECGSYALTPDSRVFLSRNSPLYAGSIAEFIANSTSLDNFRDVAKLVRTGKTTTCSAITQPENERWVHFARTMVPVIMPAAEGLAAIVTGKAHPKRVLDIAAGSGMFGIAVGRKNPQAQIVAADWKNVLAVANENAARFGIGDRYHNIAGDVFQTDLGAGYDLVIVSNFLHHFAADTNVPFLQKLRSTLNPGGRLATVEFMPNEDRVTPPMAAAFSFQMLGNTDEGEAYPFSSLDRMFRAAGFGESEVYPLTPTPLTLLLTTREEQK